MGMDLSALEDIRPELTEDQLSLVAARVRACLRDEELSATLERAVLEAAKDKAKLADVAHIVLRIATGAVFAL